MGIVQSKWEQGLCRSENGVYFANDTAVLLNGRPDQGYVPGKAVAISAVVGLGSGYWIEIDGPDARTVEGGGFIAVFGGGAIEGEGFLALLTASRELLWILHLAVSEAFSSVAIADGKLTAVAEGYPSRNEFQIPIERPYALLVEASWATEPDVPPDCGGIR